jgi:predicted 2-oxoglutarate/Fe(II)-dependent dioxygenase YbiX
MIKEEIAPGIVIYSNVIPNSETLYKDIEEGMISAGIKWSEAQVNEGLDATVNTKTRDTSIIGVPYKKFSDNNLRVNLSEEFYSNIGKIFFENFDIVEKDYLKSYTIETEWHDQYGILKYGSGQQFTNHIDDHQKYHRRVSTVYYLNENYTGGEIKFPRFGITYKPRANQMIIFPSTYVYNHSVSPVIEGERYAVVSWLR